MRKVIDVLRKRVGSNTTFGQRFIYETKDPNETVASALRNLNARPELRDADGMLARPISFGGGCLEKKCGGCAMRINDIPALACDVKLSSIKEELVILEPLSKFTQVEDLICDHTELQDNLTKMTLWLTEEAQLNRTSASDVLATSLCTQCGICLEACPNYFPGNNFVGMAGMVPAVRVLRSAAPEDRERVAEQYIARFYEGCGQTLACKLVCPAGLDLEDLMGLGNGATIWKKRKKK